MFFSRSLQLRELATMGQNRYQEATRLVSPTVKLASRRQIDKFTKGLDPKIVEFENGGWIYLEDVLISTLEELFDVHNLIPEKDLLEILKFQAQFQEEMSNSKMRNYLPKKYLKMIQYSAHAWIGVDGSGSHR